jgi:hypothetical protein
MRKAYAKARDANEPEIIAALEKIGCMVYCLDMPLDLLVGYRGRNFLIEVKIEERRNHADKHTDFQKDFFGLNKEHPEREWLGQKATVHNVQEALEVVTA